MGFFQKVLQGFGYAPITLPPVSLVGEVIPAYRPITSPSISTKLAREDVPRFNRTYKASLPNGFTVEIEMRSYGFQRHRDARGCVTQSNGKWIFFDGREVADKIIDRDLAPQIQSLSDQVLLLDEQFCKTSRNEFTDESGVRWVRADRILANAAIPEQNN